MGLYLSQYDNMNSAVLLLGTLAIHSLQSSMSSITELYEAACSCASLEATASV
jgi:hypothetical protein